MIPHAQLEEFFPRGSTLPGGVVGSEGGLGAVLFSHIRTLTEQLHRLKTEDAHAITSSTLELLAAAVAPHVIAPSTRLSRSHLRRAQEYVLEHLHEGDLTPARIAAASGLSVRYLHLLFEQVGQSLGSWILDQRLERVRVALRDPAFADCTVTDIAFQWGFNDISHFSRAFKKQHGQTPTSYRRSGALTAR